MAQPARTRPAPAELEKEEPPAREPGAVDRAYRVHRARRRARVERQRAVKRAGARFWFVLAGLILASLVLLVTIWSEVERLFGL
jgi:hypothetical protein